MFIMHLNVCFVMLALLAVPALAAKPPPPPPLPPLVLDMAHPVVTVTVAGAPLRLRVDPAAARHVTVNASAARRLGLADPGRLVAGQPADRGRSQTDVGKVRVEETTIAEIIDYQGRALPLELAWSERDLVTDADGTIAPRWLPHDDVRFVRRPATAADVETVLPMRWESNRGLLGSLATGSRSIDIQIAPDAGETIATAAAAAWLAQDHGGRLAGPIRDLVISHGVVRPVRDIKFEQPVEVAGVRVARLAARLFDWSGKAQLPAETAAADEIIVRGRFDGQRSWPKLALGNDVLGDCAELAWQRLPLQMVLTCPRPR